jgi:hypothetical protein
MKKQVIFLISMFLFSIVLVQSNAQNSSPEFKGDQNVTAIRSADNSDLVNNYLLEHLVCPKQAAECCKEGTEIVQFTITPPGNITDFKVINSVCPELDKEVIRVLKTTYGMWEPGVKNGNPAAMTTEVAFMFGDQDKSDIVNYFVQAASRHYKNGSKNLIIKNKPGKALYHFNQGINYMPNDKAMLALRGLCHYELGDETSAIKDWERIIDLGGVAHGTILNELASLKGYEEMTKMLVH